jgi:HrpA-like RNA helicase
MMQYESFNKELERLASINNIDKRLLKYAYEREFKRAQNRLPFYGFRSEILDSLATNDVIVVIGETGSGKTTQVVQYLLESSSWSKKDCLHTAKKVCNCKCSKTGFG